MPHIRTAAALLGDFDPAFPDERGLGPEDDRVPGRDLAELVAAGLREQGLGVDGPSCDEPFFVVSCRSGEVRYQVLCGLLEPKERDSVWIVECPRTLGWWARLRGRSEEAELTRVVTALHEVFTASPRVRQVRWFDDDVPPDAFEGTRGAGRPVGAG